VAAQIPALEPPHPRSTIEPWTIVERWIFFGPWKTSFKGRFGAVNLPLIGQMEGIEKTDEYGQNIPFVSIRVTG